MPITAADLAKAKQGTNLPGAFGQHYAPPTPTAPAAAPKPAAAATPAPASGGGGGYSAPAAPDPYAQWGGKANYDRAVADYNAIKGTTFSGIQEGIGQGQVGYQSGILDYIDNEKLQQNKINSQAVQNELAKMQASRGILDMVGRGIRSGGIMLANKNATTSSAADELARAYGDIGRRQESGVNIDYAKGQNAVQQSQDELNAANVTEARKISENKASIINSIVNDATNKLTALNQAAAGASLPDRIPIDQEIANVKARAIDALSKYDNMLSENLTTNAPSSDAARRASASELLSAGNAPDQSFSFTTAIPAQFANTGPFGAELPIFTSPVSKKDQTTVASPA